MKKMVEKEFLDRENTEEKVLERMQKVNAEKEKIKSLNPRFYYNNKYEPFGLVLLALSDPPSIDSYTTTVANMLTSLGINVEIKTVNGKDFSSMLQKGEKNYDLIIIGFEATGRFSRIGQIFLSTEAKNGINFSKIESKNLDTLFASLRTADTEEKTKTVMEKIGEFMQDEAFFLPISSPLHTIYVDKNLK
jgi:ABC-type transport system substrate-binding protein